MQITKYVTANGDVVEWTIEVTNSSPIRVAKDVQVIFTLPAGISLTGPTDPGSSIINVAKGFVLTATSTWLVGDLAVGQSVTTTFEITVDDITEADAIDNRFIIDAEATIICTETDLTNNSDKLIIEVGAAPEEEGECASVDLTFEL